MCRAEAHQLFSRKPIFDAMGFQLIAVLHEQIEPEVISTKLVLTTVLYFLENK